MSQQPWMPLYVGDYRRDTTHLKGEEHGTYLLILMAMWAGDGTAPDDDADLARIACLTLRRWRAIKPRIMPFFRRTADGRLTQKRLAQEYSNCERRAHLRAVNGALGGRPRKTDSAKTRQADGTRKSPVNSRSGDSSGSQPETIRVNETKDLVKAGVSDSRARVTTTNITSTDSTIVDSPPPPQTLFAEVAAVVEPPIDDAVRLWNETASQCGLAVIKSLTPKRRAALRARLQQHGIGGWLNALLKIRESEFLKGGGERGWKVDFDYAVRESGFLKIIEGGFDRSRRSRTAIDIIAERMATDEQPTEPPRVAAERGGAVEYLPPAGHAERDAQGGHDSVRQFPRARKATG